MTFNTFLSQLMLYKVGLTGWFILHFLVYWPKELLSLFIPVQYGTIQTMIGTPTDGYTLSTVIIGWFILGSILGWIYGKIVNRNRV
ncbi:MAG: hypothetical protein Q7S72_00535 [Candidatus Taylorbacteria bacterium]|nr:hypothetical protein [Candidatus Taylorbacteria bacterium]